MTNDSRHWQVTLEIKREPPKGVDFPYGYRVVLVGFFYVDGSVAAENEERFVRIQGASVLYGMAREIVRAVSRMVRSWCRRFHFTIRLRNRSSRNDRYWDRLDRFRQSGGCM